MFALEPIISGANCRVINFALALHSLIVISLAVMLVITYLDDFFEQTTMVVEVAFLCKSMVLLCAQIVIVIQVVSSKLFNYEIYNLCWFFNFKAFHRRREQQSVIRALLNIDKQLIAHFDSNIKLYSIDRRQTRKFIVIIVATVYSYTHFSYLIFEITLWLTLPIVFNRFRCIQLSFYLDMIGVRLASINNELYQIEKTHPNDRTKNGCFYKVLILKSMFSDMWKTASLLNDCFSWSIAAITSEIFLEVTINTYLLSTSMGKGRISLVGLTIYCLGMMPAVFAFLLSCRSADSCTWKVICGKHENSILKLTGFLVLWNRKSCTVHLKGLIKRVRNYWFAGRIRNANNARNNSLWCSWFLWYKYEIGYGGIEFYKLHNRNIEIKNSKFIIPGGLANYIVFGRIYSISNWWKRSGF